MFLCMRCYSAIGDMQIAGMRDVSSSTCRGRPTDVGTPARSTVIIGPVSKYRIFIPDPALLDVS